MRIFALILSLVSAPAVAHEFWIEPLSYQIAPDDTLEAKLVNGQEFSGVEIGFFPSRFANFALFAGADAARVQGRPGDTPALNQAPFGEGLHIAVYQANNATVDYETWEKFQTFVDHKDFGDVLSRHQARSLPEAEFDEVYARYSKTLIGVGDSSGADRRVGLETEIVALNNPYTDDLPDGFSVQVFYRDDIRADTQVEVFRKAPDDSVTIELYRTNAEGIATFPVIPGYSYMVDAVVLKEPGETLSEQTGAVWQTLWANLTFAVPE